MQRMGIEYSSYEAKAKFSEVLRVVREGKTVTLLYRGEPVAEIHPIQQPETIDDRLKELEQRGVLMPSRAVKRQIPTVEARPGALQRFLAERDE